MAAVDAERQYVVKIIRKACLFSAEERESVCREAHIHATLRHPNIVALHDAFEDKVRTAVAPHAAGRVMVVCVRTCCA